jgi:hypothetical protein
MYLAVPVYYPPPPLRKCPLHRANVAGPTRHVRKGGIVIMALVGAGGLVGWRLKLWLSYFWTNHRCLAELCLGPMRGMMSTS